MKIKNTPLLFVLAVACLRTAMAANAFVPAGGDLQAALNAAHPGDVISLAAGATFSGHFYLAPNPGPQWITIQSSALSSLPAGNRVSPAQAGAMPKLVTPNGGAVLVFASGANYYHIIGLEILPASGVYGQDLIEVGTAQETSVNQLPHDIDFDRDYIHGDPGAGSKRGIALNGGTTMVQNSYFSAFTSSWQDTQALCGWNGPGPYQIINNYLEAGTETVAFGGAPTAIAGVVPSDILIQNNYFFKPLSWQQSGVWVKNHLELKNGQRITINGNIFENNWAQQQAGYALVFTVRTELGAVPWATVNNIQVTNNVIKHSGQGIVFAGHDDNPAGSGTAGSFLVQNNVWQDINSSWGGNGHLFVILNGVQGITMDHNTAFQNGGIMVFDIAPSFNINFTNNTTLNGAGVIGDGTVWGTPTLNTYAPGGVFAGNALIGAPASAYPGGNFFPASMDQLAFWNPNFGDYQLMPGSAFKAAGTDGQDVGANLQTAESTPTIPTGWFNLVSKNSGKCLDVAGVSSAPGTQIQQWDCYGGDNQKFQFSPVSGGYEVTAMNSGIQLDLWGGPGATWDGAPVKQWPFYGASNEIWQVTQTPDGYYSLKPSNSGKCMDVADVSQANGAIVQQWSCYGGDNQKWSFVPAQ